MEQQLLQKILVIRETLHRNINKSEELYKILPDDLFKQKYVKEDKSVRKIAEELNLSYGYTLRRLKEINILRDKSDSRKNIHSSQWKGNDASLHSIHVWVNNRKPKPKFCEKCKKVPPIDLANISGEYHRDINDFKWMCRSCHMIMDYKNNMRKIKPSKRIKGDLLLCSRCNNFKLINKFSKNKNVKGGYSYNCKECEKQRHHKYNIEKKYAKGIN